jgi:predicted nuclease of restriction endonuclease-like (RecB) superfamily
VEGFSRTNLFRMKAFYMAYAIVPQAVGQFEVIYSIPWGHNVVIFEQVKISEQRLWYAQMAIKEGWSRNALTDAIKKNLYKRHGKATTNFQTQLPSPQSILAQETVKDPYLFDFLELGPDHQERHLEEGLLRHVERFLLELGTGFAFIGSQYQIQVSGKTYYLDLLFYHIELRCFFVVELKSTEFRPEYSGKMNFYLSAVDDQLKKEADNPTLGLLICRHKDDLTVEYALRDIKKPMAVSAYLTEALPKKLAATLPTIAQIEAELGEMTLAPKPKRSKKK